MKRAIIQTDHLLTFRVELPVPGRVNVHLGQSVEPGDRIAEAVLPAKIQVFDVINHFRIKASDLERCLKRLAGEDVQRGDVIAKKSGLISRFFRAPDDGKVVAVRDGRVTLAMGEKTIDAVTPIAGVIGEIIPGLGAAVVARGLSLQGSWGNGKTAIGRLLIQDAQWQDKLNEINGAIVFLEEIAALTDLEELKNKGAVGILVTSLDPSLKMDLEEFDLPVMSLLGFGEATLDQFSRSVIEELQDSQVTLVARQPDSYRDLKPELFQPRATYQTEELFAKPEPKLIGRTVRLLGQPYFGSVGKIIELPTKTERLASGIQSRVAVVEREDQTVIRIPLENLELVTN